tara:strand:- start:689 stop:1831 length:1143 start_codon:yes stop_codon:yes gene_type:complete
MINFDFTFRGTIFFGIGKRNNLNKIIEQENFKTAGIVIDHALVEIPIFQDFLKLIKIKIILIKCDIAEPTYEKLEQKRIEVKNKDIDVFIGIGGGSALDLAKGLSVLSKNTGPAISYRGFDQFREPIPPVIAIPTTAGTGSEITPNASFIDTDEKKKLGINGEAIRPKYAILDPELTLSCPLSPTISAGVDSMVHATEAFIAKKTNPVAKMFAKKGFSLVFKNLELLAHDLEDLDLRENVMYGAFMSAIALMNSGTGPAAAMSYPLGVHFGVPHGIGGGIFLPHVIDYNIKSGFYDYAYILDDEKDTNSIKDKAYKFSEKIFKSWSNLNVPSDLKIFGMQEKDKKVFISNTLDLKMALDQNPIPFNEKEIKNILSELLKG